MRQFLVATALVVFGVLGQSVLAEELRPITHEDVWTVLVITSQDGEQLCYQLLAQPFIGGFSIQFSVRSEEVIEDLPVG